MPVTMGLLDSFIVSSPRTSTLKSPMCIWRILGVLAFREVSKFWSASNNGKKCCAHGCTSSCVAPVWSGAWLQSNQSFAWLWATEKCRASTNGVTFLNIPSARRLRIGCWCYFETKLVGCLDPTCQWTLSHGRRQTAVSQLVPLHDWQNECMSSHRLCGENKLEGGPLGGVNLG